MTDPTFDDSNDSGTDTDYVSDPVTTSYDLSGDGVFDTELTQFSDGSYYMVMDSDFDANADTVALDTTGDGQVDTLVVRLADDSYVLSTDLDNDGSFDDSNTMSRADLADMFPGALTLLDSQFVADPGAEPNQQPWIDPTDPGTDPTVDPNNGPDVPVDPSNDPVNWVEDGKLVGDPSGDAEHWFQQAQNGFCVPASVAQIVAEYTGQDFTSEEQFVNLANEQGLFVVGMDGVPGMTMDGAEQLLNDAGVPAQLTVGTVDTLAQSLEEGRRVMLFVDSGEIWYGEDVEDNAADHAITVTGIDYERGVVIISDTGDPNGNQNELSIADFEDAWADSGYAMVQCDNPAPQDGGPEVSGEPVDDAANLGAERVGDTGTEVAGAVHAPTQIESMSAWVVDHPWVLLPVVLGAGALVAKI